MGELISQSKPKARKAHHCMASDFVRESGHVSWMTFTERKAFVRAKRNGFQIQKGEVYEKACMKDGSIVYTFRAIPAMHDICVKYDLYPED